MHLGENISDFHEFLERAQSSKGFLKRPLTSLSPGTSGQYNRMVLLFLESLQVLSARPIASGLCLLRDGPGFSTGQMTTGRPKLTLFDR